MSQLDIQLDDEWQKKKDLSFWMQYAEDCLKISRKPKGKVMSEQEFYKGVGFLDDDDA